MRCVRQYPEGTHAVLVSRVRGGAMRWATIGTVKLTALPHLRW